MKISNIRIKSEGYVSCKSSFYSAKDSLSGDLRYTFLPGIDKLIGEIDSGNWAISYLLSMYKHCPEDFVLFEEPKVVLNNEWISLNELSEFTCYLDVSDPLFSTADSVKECIIRGLSHSTSTYSYDDIKKMFDLDSERVERPLGGVGNEIFRAMAAIGFSYGKEIFCFPWFSAKRFESYHNNITALLQILEKSEKTVILPVGNASPKT